MSVSEQYSGIVGTHITAIEQAAKSKNTFIFIRPTEYDSTILIRAGYATKSMDVHHKSSNWGPMAGFVPCDPAFSKKCIGSPDPMESEVKHGAAHPAQLALKPELLTAHKKVQFPTGFILSSSQGGKGKGVEWIVKRQSGGGSVSKAKEKFDAFQSSGGNIPEHKFCTALPTESGVKSTLFCLIKKSNEWLVYWVSWKGDTGTLHPLRVFAYAQGGRLNPVTGDYDLWMVAPHFKHFNKHSVVRLEEDVHGESAASAFTMSLMKTMNGKCGRADNPVFHHGAEAQNYGFTQALDWNLAMFTPGGTSRMVRMNQMPQILSDLQRAGYIAVWNKRYGEADPHLSSKADPRGEASLVKIRSEL
ncbi:MAG: anthrax toxin-like adenylyl cyclase domain-containing protein, partial [Bacteroidales bacterium]